MAAQRRAICFHCHLIVLLFVVSPAAVTRSVTAERVASAQSARSPAPAVAPASLSFLHARCTITLYPALCYDSLLPYAAKFQTSYLRLAGVAADVSAAHLRALLANVKEHLQHASSSRRPSETDALRDCVSTISAAANLARQSSAELAGLDLDDPADSAGGSSSRRPRWAVSNAKTWLSAAITNEGTCGDGIMEAGAAESPAGKQVDAGVAKVQQHTSIALALVNGIPL